MENFISSDVFFAPHPECPRVCDCTDEKEFKKQKQACDERQYAVIEGQISKNGWDSNTFLSSISLDYQTETATDNDMNNSTQYEPISPPLPSESKEDPLPSESKEDPLLTSADPWLNNDNTTTFCKSLLADAGIKNPNENPLVETDFTVTGDDILLDACQLSGLNATADATANANANDSIDSGNGSDASTPRSPLTAEEMQHFTAVAGEVESILTQEG